MRDVTWFFRGVQSAIFLYASCAPCYGAAAKRRRRKEAKRSREEKARLKETDPIANHQPAPFEINPFWQEEIEAGPGPPARKVKRPKPKAAISAVPVLALDGVAIEAGVPGVPGAPMNALHGGGKLEAKMEQYRDRIKNFDPAHIKESWHNRRQRRDEEYTSDDESDDGIGSSLPLHLRRLGQTAKPKNPSGRYYISKAPPVNDLHPPIVCTPSPYPSERRWMKEPPPSAAFMAGREGTRTSGRSRAGSRASTATRTHQPSPRISSVNLGRQVTSRAIEERIRRGVSEVEMLLGSQTSTGQASSSKSTTSLHTPPDNVRVMDYADASTPSSSLDIQHRGGPSSSKSRLRGKARSSLGYDSSDSEAHEITPTTTTTTVDSFSKLEAAHRAASIVTGRRSPNESRYSRPRSVSNGGAGFRHITVDNAQKSHAGSERTSPTPSAQRSSSPSSPALRFQARALNASITSAPVSPLLAPALDEKGQAVQGDGHQPLISVKNFSLDVLQELVSPSSALNTRHDRSPPVDARGKFARSSTGGRTGPASDHDNDGDDGWLWTESGERRWRDQSQARDVRNRWSIDF